MESGDLAPVIVSGVFFISMAMVLIFRGPLGRALARRIEGSAGQSDPAAVAEVEARVAHLEQQLDRLHELEERLDFTERLLAQERERPRLGS